MKFSLWPQAANPPGHILDEVRWADEAGWHSVWLADHYMPNTGTRELKPGNVHEVWSLLPAVATVTSQVRFGTLVSPTSIHHPALLANRASTLDHLSNGRFTLGLGAGWQINEHAAYGVELEAPKERVDRFEEAIRIVRSLLDNDRTTFHGSVYDVTDAPCDPKPVQRPLPILVGTSSPRMLRIAAAHANQWNTSGSVEVAIKNRASLMAAADTVGRDPSEFWTTANIQLDLGSTGYDAQGPSPILRGNRQQLIDQLAPYIEAGFDELVISTTHYGSDLQERLDRYARIDEEIVTAFQTEQP